MKFLKTLPTLIALTVLSPLSFAQEPQAQPGQQQQQQRRQRTDDSTMTGCLAKGTSTGQYVLTDKAGAKTDVKAGAGVELEKHAANHTVRLSGSKAADGTFTASKVEHVSATCETK